MQAVPGQALASSRACSRASELKSSKARSRVPRAFSSAPLGDLCGLALAPKPQSAQRTRRQQNGVLQVVQRALSQALASSHARVRAKGLRSWSRVPRGFSSAPLCDLCGLALALQPQSAQRTRRNAETAARASSSSCRQCLARLSSPPAPARVRKNSRAGPVYRAGSPLRRSATSAVWLSLCDLCGLALALQPQSAQRMRRQQGDLVRRRAGGAWPGSRVSRACSRAPELKSSKARSRVPRAFSSAPLGDLCGLALALQPQSAQRTRRQQRDLVHRRAGGVWPGSRVFQCVRESPRARKLVLGHPAGSSLRRSATSAVCRSSLDCRQELPNPRQEHLHRDSH